MAKLKATLAAATRAGYVPSILEARLALCDAERATRTPAADARCAALEKDARAQGFLLVARQAATP